MTGRGREYASALFDVAVSDDCLDEVYEGLKVIREVLEGSEEFVELLMSPAIPKEERVHIVEQSFGGNVCEDLVAFMCVLTEKSHVRDLWECFEVFDELYKEAARKSTAIIRSAVELSDDAKKRLVEKLQKISGHSVEPVYRIDESLIGGVIVEMEGMRLDGSIRKKLQEIKEVMEP
ncbi:F-type H+-transporting ATPase subunit delta [Ruminococcaceae bacterium YRB3002]|nr:F-type H+-transporting ATPase subunit delta [Ruminococcaceae bacterium YRB3002]